MSDSGSQPPTPVVSRDELLQRVDGDMELLEELVDLFLEDLPARLQGSPDRQGQLRSTERFYVVIKNVLLADVSLQILGIRSRCHNHLGVRLDGLEDGHSLVPLHLRQIYVNNHTSTP